MKTVCNENVSSGVFNSLPASKNVLLLCPKPEILDADGNSVMPKTGCIENIVKSRPICDGNHVQLHAKLPITATYQLISNEPLTDFLISTMSQDEADYGWGSYEIYLSMKKEDLYSKENKVFYFDRKKQKEFAVCGRYALTQLISIDTDKIFKYLGIKFIEGSSLDTVVRFDHIAAYTKSAIAMKKEIIRFGADVTSIAEFEYNQAKESICYRINTKTDTVIASNVDFPMIITEKDGNTFTLCADGFERIFICDKQFFIHKKEYNTASITANCNCDIYVFSGETNIKILPEKIINSNFLGAGINVIPTNLMEDGISAGYSDDFLQKEKDFIMTLKPLIARIWFQNDWFQTAPYKYDFNSPKMQAFLKYMQPFKELQTELEIDFSFAVGSAIQSWFAFENVLFKGRSAPKDLKQFAHSIIACLHFLRESAGLNVKYITISNEPDGPNFAVEDNTDDNLSPEEKSLAYSEKKMEYYAQALIEIDAAMKADGIRNDFEIWAPESCGKSNIWIKSMYEKADFAIDRYTRHSYSDNNNEMATTVSAGYLNAVNGKNVCLTEFGCSMPTYEKSTVGCFISAAKGGLDCALEWTMANAVLSDPFSGGEYAGLICLWINPKENGKFTNKPIINPICYEYGPLMRYIKPHSQVIDVSVFGDFDARSVGFKNGDDFTLVVETRNSGKRKLNIDLSGITDKPIKKLHYDISSAKTFNSVLQNFEPVNITDGRIITENLDETHSVYIYTTLE